MFAKFHLTGLFPGFVLSHLFFAKHFFFLFGSEIRKKWVQLQVPSKVFSRWFVSATSCWIITMCVGEGNRGDTSSCFFLMTSNFRFEEELVTITWRSKKEIKEQVEIFLSLFTLHLRFTLYYGINCMKFLVRKNVLRLLWGHVDQSRLICQREFSYFFVF